MGRYSAISDGHWWVAIGNCFIHFFFIVLGGVLFGSICCVPCHIILFRVLVGSLLHVTGDSWKTALLRAVASPWVVVQCFIYSLAALGRYCWRLSYWIFKGLWLDCQLLFFRFHSYTCIVHGSFSLSLITRRVNKRFTVSSNWFRN